MVLRDTSNKELIEELWLKQDSRKELLANRFFPLVREYLDLTVLGLFQAIREADSVAAIKTLIQKVELNRQPIFDLFQRLYVPVGLEFGKLTMEGLKSGSPDILTKSDDVDVSAPIETPLIQRMRDIAQMEAGRKVSGILAQNRKLISAIVDEGIKEGWSVFRMQEAIFTNWDGVINEARATTIARTEVLSASNWGAWETALISGVQLEKVWIATPYGDFRPNHLAQNLKRLPMEESFKVGNVFMRRPHDPEAPADEVINCRCTLGFVPV